MNIKMQNRSVQQIVEEQAKKWRMAREEKKGAEPRLPVVTISREAGSRGCRVARLLAERLGLDLFDREIIQGMADSSKISDKFLETLDERGISVLEDYVSSFVNKRYLWPDQYLQHLIKIVGTIGKHGNAVIVGRGAGFALPLEECFRVRVVAPLDIRIANMAEDSDISTEEARRGVQQTAADRSAFVGKYFHVDITDPVNYDLVVNTGRLSMEAAVEAIAGALGKWRS